MPTAPQPSSPAQNRKRPTALLYQGGIRLRPRPRPPSPRTNTPQSNAPPTHDPQTTHHCRLGDACSTGLPDSCADLVTVAQALHWFDPRSFCSEARRILNSQGTLAVWCYGLACVEGPDHPADQVLRGLYGGVLDEYWDERRRLVERMYQGETGVWVGGMGCACGRGCVKAYVWSMHAWVQAWIHGMWACRHMKVLQAICMHSFMRVPVACM